MLHYPHKVPCSCLFWAQSVFPFLLADIIFSTAHKAKGLEFDTVRVTDDFLPGTDIGVAWSECGHRLAQAIWVVSYIGCRQFLGFVLDRQVTCNKCHVARVLTNHPVSGKTKESWLNFNRCFELLVQLWRWLLLFWFWLWLCCSCCCNYAVLVFVFVVSLTYRAHSFLVNRFFFSWFWSLLLILLWLYLQWCLWVWYYCCFVCLVIEVIVVVVLRVLLS